MKEKNHTRRESEANLREKEGEIERKRKRE